MQIPIFRGGRCMTIIFLQNIFEKSINGEWGNEDSGKGEATAVIRTSNFLNSGRLNLDNIVCREIDKDKNSGKILRTGDIIIEKSGGSPNQPVGRVVYFDVTDQDYFTNNFTSILRVKPGYNSKYIFYLMKYLYDTKKVLKFQNKTTGIINLKLADYLNKTKVNIEAIENQNTIVDILDRLEYQIINRNKQLSKLSNLVKSRFNEMFGDDSKFEKVLLGCVCDVRDGTHDSPKYVEKGYPLITSKNITGGVIDFRNTNHITQMAFNKINQRSKVDYGDILLPMIGTVGNPVVVETHKKFAIKNVALIKFYDKSKVDNVYIKNVLTSFYFDKQVLQKIRGGTQKFIALKDIRELQIPLPPLSLQNEFADFVAQVDKSQFACQIVIKLWRNSLKSSII